MKSTQNTTVNCTKHLNLGKMPLFVSMIHRHFEKEKPAAFATMEEGGALKWGQFSAPVDLLRLSVSDEIVNEISEIAFSYRKKS